MPAIVKERLSAERWAPPWLRHQHIARYRWATQYCAGKRVIEAACANGYGSKLLREGGAASVDAYDVSDVAIAEARRLHAAAGISYTLGDARSLPAPDRSYDVYVSFETIEHIERDDDYLTEARRVLKAGGIFLCSTPNRRMLNPGTTIAHRPFNPYHVREYTLEELEPKLRARFDRVELLGQSPFPLRYSKALALVGGTVPMAAVRLHQMRKVLGIPWESLERHWPKPLPLAGVPEVLLAICS